MRRDYLLIIGLACLCFLPFLGAVHLFDWDEINFAECAREMLRTGDWSRPQIDFEPFWEKPPLFLWMQGVAMRLFGVNEFAARLPNVLCGVATLLVVYRIGRKLHDPLFGWLWVLAWIGSILPQLYFHSGIIDPWFNFFIFCGLFGFINFRWQFFGEKASSSRWHKYQWLLYGGGLLGLAVLTKGPTALLIAGLVIGIYWARYRFKGRGYLVHTLVFIAAAGVAAALWFGLEILLHGTWFVREFIVYQIRLFTTQDAGHGGFWGYHFVVLLLGCFPISVFALPNLWGDQQSEEEMMGCDTLACCKRSDFGTWMQILFWVVLILFSIVQTKIVHYSSLCYFPLTYLGAVTIWRAVRWDIRPRITTLLLPVLGIIIGATVLALPYLGNHIEQLKPFFAKDRFALANLDADVQWMWWQGIPGAILIISSLLGLYFWQRYRFWLCAQVVFGGGAVFTVGTLVGVACNIEGYSQHAAVEFYQSKAEVDCFIIPVGFKSYAHLFYADKHPPGVDTTIDNYESLAHGNPGKPVFFVAKITNLGELPNLPDCHELYRKNGFVFYERTIAK